MAAIFDPPMIANDLAPLRWRKVFRRRDIESGLGASGPKAGFGRATINDAFDFQDCFDQSVPRRSLEPGFCGKTRQLPIFTAIARFGPRRVLTKRPAAFRAKLKLAQQVGLICFDLRQQVRAVGQRRQKCFFDNVRRRA